METDGTECASNEDEYFEEALKLVQEAGVMVLEAFSQPRSKEVMTKASDVDLVTDTDKKVEQLLFSGLSAKFPHHKFIGEESTSEGQPFEYTDAPTWIIDPIDGTTNFVHRLPFIGICVGLTIQKRLRIGIVYNPILRDLFTARAGRGAFKNGFPIHASHTKEPGKALIADTLGIHCRASCGPGVTQIYLNNLLKLTELGIRGHRSFGSAALNMCYVAEGAADGYVEYGLHCWDMAASGLIVLEAGGQMIDPSGGEFDLMSRRVLCAGTPELAQEMSKHMTNVDYPKEA